MTLCAEIHGDVLSTEMMWSASLAPLPLRGCNVRNQASRLKVISMQQTPDGEQEVQGS